MDAVAQRLRRIGVTPKVLAQKAGVNYATFYRGLSVPGSNRISNAVKFQDALFEMEIELRDYLLALHPLPAVPQPKLEAVE